MPINGSTSPGGKIRIVVIVLSMLFVIVLGILAKQVLDRMGIEYPSRQKIANLQTDIEKMSSRWRVLTLENEKAQLNRDRLESLSSHFWKPGKNNPGLKQIQRTIQKLAEDSGLSLTTVGSPQTKDINDHIVAVDLAIRSDHTSIKTIARFASKIDHHRPILEWQQFKVQVNSPKNPTHIFLSKGRIRAYLLTENTMAILENRQPEEKK